jgi:hypothetical protein
MATVKKKMNIPNGNGGFDRCHPETEVDQVIGLKENYRQSSTAYTVGNIAYHSALPTGWYLECTTAGTTSSSDLSIISPSIGGTVSDGTVTWTVRQVASTKNLEGFVNDGIYAVTSSIRRKVSSSFIQIVGGTDVSICPYLELIGPLNTNISEGQRGRFALVAQNSENTIGLSGYVNGKLIWNGNSLDKSAVVAESLGANGYIKYASGLIVQWGGLFESSARELQFPIAFTNTPKVNVTAGGALSIIVSIHNTQVSTAFYLPDGTRFDGSITWNYIAIGY